MSQQYSPTGFKVLPTVVKNLLIINALFFLAAFTFERFKIDLTDYLGLHFFMAKDFRVYQFVTSMFLHDTHNFSHLFFNMFALWMFGNILENMWGAKRFLLFYMVCGLGAGLCQELAQYIEYAVLYSGMSMVPVTLTNGAVIQVPIDQYFNLWTAYGASGAVFGLLLAFGMMFPNEMIYLYFFVPIKAKWFVIGYAALELVFGFIGGDNVGHFAHLGGMLFGLILILIWKKKGKLYGDQVY